MAFSPGAADLRRAIAVPPAEAVAYLRGKGAEISGDWTDFWQEAHDESFVVAQMARDDLLALTRDTIAEMQASGAPLAGAAADLEAAYRDAGWWGKQATVDAEGRARIVQLGSLSRIRTILVTNMLTGYGAGRLQRQRAVIDTLPYWEYLAVLDPRTRESHRELDGLVFRADDPIWATIYPPNGFFCRCRTRALSAAEVERRGLSVLRSTAIEPVTDRVGVDKRTGEIVERPGRIVRWRDPDGARRAFRPDPGWSHAPGASLAEAA